MRVIVISHNGAARYQAGMECLGRFSPNTMPRSIVTASCREHEFAYSLAASRGLHWFNMAGTPFRDAVIEAASIPKRGGGLEQFTIFLPDWMVISRKVNFQAASVALMGDDVVGLSLFLSKSTPGSPVMMGRPIYGGIETWEWELSEASGEWERYFSYGTIYRTSDILGPLSRNTWESPATMCDALNRDATLRRRRKMACMESPNLLCLPPSFVDDDNEQMKRYLNGEVIDVDAMLAQSKKFVWKPDN